MNNIAWIILLTIIFEAVTCFFRFILKLEATRDTEAIARYTFGLRIHHGYWGVLLIVVAYFMPADTSTYNWTIRIGWALILSDLVHHFLVLWPIIGDHQFHLKYPHSSKSCTKK